MHGVRTGTGADRPVRVVHFRAPSAGAQGKLSMGGYMSDLRSRAAVFGLTTGAAVLLAVPVAASGQVPGVDRVVGGVNKAAQGVVQGVPPVKLPVLPIQLPAPPPAPAPAAPAAPAPATSSPAPPAATPSAPTPSRPIAQSAGSPSSPAARSSVSGVRAAASSSHQKAKAAQESGSGATDVEIADEAAEAPRDASPATLPFTGLQLALMLTAGLAVLATGAALRWTVR
jgi:hypothetical protein